MKLSSFLLFFVFAAQSQVFALSKQEALAERFQVQYDLSEYFGQTYLSFLQDEVKPALDQIDQEGYQIATPQDVDVMFEGVNSKVQWKIGKNGGVAVLKEIVTSLEGETVSVNNLHDRIRAVKKGVDIYDLSTILGLASGGGVSIKYAKDNYSFNVHYDDGEQKSGRSFSTGPKRLANDASYKAYLEDVEAYIEKSPTDLIDFNQNLVAVLLNNDVAAYAKMTAQGQAIMSDFLAIYTAEQVRNIMDGKIEPHWDAAILEVTLLANFHAGQSRFMLYYDDRATEQEENDFTDTVWEQARCQAPSKKRAASMVDYWQFSERIDDPKNCGRSGVNITKRQFRLLGDKITAYMYRNQPEVTKRLAKSMGVSGTARNLFYEFSALVIDGAAPQKITSTKSNEMTQAWVAFLEAVYSEAEQITEELK